MHKMDIEEAKRKGLEMVNPHLPPEWEMVIPDEYVWEFEEGYVFNYETKKYHEGDESWVIVGKLAKIGVDKLSGEVFLFHFDRPIRTEKDIYDSFIIALKDKEKRHIM